MKRASGLAFLLIWRSKEMRKDFGVKTWLYPQPVLIVGSYDEQGRPDAMNAAWGAIYDSDQVVLCLDKSHKTTRNIITSKAFTLSFATVDTITSADYVGIVSGNKEQDKIGKAGWTVKKSTRVNAPIIEELPLVMECELVRIDAEEHVIGKIVNVSVDESVLGEDGKPDYTLIRPVTYDPVHFNYVALGNKVARAFSEGRKLVE